MLAGILPSRSGAWPALRGRTTPRTRSIDVTRSDRFRSTFPFEAATYQDAGATRAVIGGLYRLEHRQNAPGSALNWLRRTYEPAFLANRGCEPGSVAGCGLGGPAAPQ